MKTSIKRWFISGLATLLGVAITLPVAHAEVSGTDLSWTPPYACKKPPKAPPRNLLRKTFKHSEGAPKNWPFMTTVDINGDGWCDWIGQGAVGFYVRSDKPYDEDEPQLDDFIYLGMPDGWRRIKKPGVSAPAAAGFVDPLFVYSPNNRKPFIVALDGSEIKDVFTPEHVYVSRWNDHDDRLHDVNPKESERIIHFILKTSCATKKDYSTDYSTIGVICYGANKSCPEGRESCKGKMVR